MNVGDRVLVVYASETLNGWCGLFREGIVQKQNPF